MTSKKRGKLLKNKIKTNLSYLERRLSLERFIPLVFIFFLLIFIGLSIITYLYIKQYKDDVVFAGNIQEILIKTRKIDISLLKIQVSRQNYVLTGDNTHLTQYYDSQNEIKHEIDGLKNFMPGDNELYPFVLKLDSLLRELLVIYNNSIDEFEEKKFLGEPRLITLGSSEDALTEINNIIEYIKNKQNEQFAERNSWVLESSLNTQLFIIITSLFAFTVISLALYFSNRLIKNKNLTEGLLYKSYEELENRVDERTKEIKTVNENLVEEISNRIKIENQLRQSEERFRVMADSAPVMIWMSGKDKLYNYFNNGWLEFTGRTLGQEKGNGWTEGIHHDDLQRCLDIYILAFDKRRNFEMEFRLKNAKGEYKWVLNKGIPLYEGDQFAGYIGGCIDIHSRKSGEHYLNLQHEVSKSLTESSSMKETFSKVLNNICSNINWQFGIIWIVSAEKQELLPGVIWSYNQVHHKEFSRIYDHKITNGSDLPGLVWQSGKPVWSADLMKDHNFDRKDLAYRLDWKTGFAVPVSNGAEVIAVIECFSNEMLTSSGELLKVLDAVGRQVGNYLVRKKAEETLKTSYTELETRVKDRTIELANTLNKLLKEIDQKEKIQNKLKLFAHAIKGIKECVYITDLQNKTLFVNSSFESIYGYFEEELLNKEIPVLFSEEVPGEKRNEILTSTHRSGWRGELKNRRKDNSEFYIHLSTSVIRNDEGVIEAVVGICQDITELKAADELAQKQNNLIKLLNDVIAVTNKSFDLNNSISYAINKVCQYNSWDAGHCYLMQESGKLRSSLIWNYNLKDEFKHIVQISESVEFERGKELPGEALKSGKSEWIILKEDDINRYPRAGALMEAGLFTCIIIPIFKHTEMIGTLEFFKKGKTKADSDILECVTNIGTELGSLAGRIGILDRIKISEKQFKAVADTANDAIITSDSKGKIIYANKSTETIFGFSNYELLNKNISILIPDNLMEKHSMAFERAVETGELVTHGKTSEFTAKNRLNKEFPVEISIAKWEINDEIYFTAMIKDISVRKEIENELMEKQKMLLEAQELSRMGSWEWDVKTNNVIWSESMYDVYEITKSDFKSSFEGFLQWIHPEDVEMVRETVLNAYNTKTPFSYYERIVTPSGKVKVLKSQGEVILDENSNVVKMFGTCLDITEMKEYESKILNSEKQLKESQQIAKLGSWEYNMVTGELSWSDELFRICGLDKDQGVLPYDQTMEFIHPHDRERIDSLINTLKNEPGKYEASFRLVTGNGTLKYIDADIVTEFDKENKAARYYGSIQDVTEIKVVEEELRKANEKLMEAQKELIHNEKLAALGRFSSGIAHEIRNPLANISALSQLLTKTKLDEKSKKHLKYILINADIANNIIKDLLNFASPDEPAFKHENLNEIIDYVLASVEPRCVENNIKINRHISNSLPKVHVDKLRIENALMNFISNAIDAMNEGGELTVKTYTEKINKTVNISISDTGSGISQEHMDKILEPFFTTKKNGTGLGLGLAYQAVKSHNGTVKIDSAPGKGTEVKINLPLNGVK